MLSRMASSLYWMSRYLERAGNTARLLEINLLYLLEAEDALPEAAQWLPLLSISGSEEIFNKCYDGAAVNAQRTVRFMTGAPDNPNSIRTSLRLARENARVVRDRISSEMWEAINQLWLRVDRQLASTPPPERSPGLYAEVRDGVARFHGNTVSTMMRGEAFSLYLLGSFVERADMTARILDVKYHLLLPDASMVGSPLDYYQWAALLKTLSGFEAYRRRYQGGMRPVDVAEFVVLEPDYPRSLRFATDRMAQALERTGATNPGSASARALGALRDHLDNVSAEEVVRSGFHEFLQEFLARVAALDAALSNDYFEVYLGEDRCAL